MIDVVDLTGCNAGGYFVHASDIEPAEPVKQLTDTEKFKQRLDKLKADAAECQAKINFIATSGNPVFSAEEYRCYQGLRVVKGAGDDYAKAKALAALFQK
jgi:hypothetical protein